MKKLSILSISAIFLLCASSCKKYLAINTNPNAATTATPEVILPQAIVYSASITSSYNNYGAELAGYAANAGGYGGFGSNWTYNFGPNDYSGLWSSSYDALNDLQAVQDFAVADKTGAHDYFNAIARIMKVYDFQLLVDTYNNIPYTDALKGASSVTPKYDDAKTIYPLLATQLDSAIAIITAAMNKSGVTVPTTQQDPLFHGNMTTWEQFAQTLKLRLIIRASGVVTFANKTFDNNIGFLGTDAIVNPGYAKISGQQNPSWNTWVQDYAGTAGNRAWMPCTYVFSFYDGANLLDNGRGQVIYYNFPSTPNNQLGVGTTSVPSAPSVANAWYSGSTSSLGNCPGIMKGLNMGEPLMLAAESDFLQAEADVRGILTQNAKTDFLSGIAASFHYLYLLPDDHTIAPGLDVKADTAQYMSDNAGSYLVNYDLANTTDKQIEAIVTQKYIALNFINSQEGWNEYRRTGYPKCSTFTSDPTKSFASTLSQSSRPDKLPTRILYPASEYSYNAKNVPTGISPYSSLIFWAH
ncbi:MAG TPA: SusD/RagB family nutrient-binding outer membrane lipoprotein [Puia sp.]|nr:SusD/RagB family nutrient-binding outer membrane lipoprotein [Puia sp.]